MPPRAQRSRLRLVEAPLLLEEAAAAERVAAERARDENAEEEVTEAQPAAGIVPAATPEPPRAQASNAATAPAGPLAELPDAQLVALGCTGESRALEQLYRRHAAFAIHLATRIEGSARDVEDIVHDAFLRAFDRLQDLEDRAAFKAWLGSIVVRAVRSRMRRSRILGVLGLGRSSEPVDLDALASPDASPHVRAQLAQVYALLRTLPADDRIAWTLRAVEGHDLETVGRLCGCSLATVKRRVGRAQQFLDDHFVDPSHGEVSL